MPQRLHVFTCAAVNYLPKVRALCRSIRQHHPEAVIHLALADARPPWMSPEGEPFDSILAVSDLGIPDWRAWTFKHSIVELSTAIKPYALQHLLCLPGCGQVLYFDPDMVLFSRVDDILATLETADIALTPHQNKPETTLEAVLDNEVASLKHGVFNLGFIGVKAGAEGLRFAAWWAFRTYHLCRAEVANGLFTDQKWINLAPIFFERTAIVRSSRHNVATWNLTTRELSGNAREGFRVDGEPLGFYHFTGFDSGDHHVMAVKNATGNPAVRGLIAWYERETAPSKDDRVVDWPWAFGRFTDGTPIEAHHRWWYRDNRDLQLAFPDPYDASAGKETFLGWCETEGRLRGGPLSAGKHGARAPAAPSSLTRVPLGMSLRLLLLAFSPKGGKSVRSRAARVYRDEGFGGIFRRLRTLASGR